MSSDKDVELPTTIAFKGIMCRDVLPATMYMHSFTPNALGFRKRAPEQLELEL